MKHNTYHPNKLAAHFPIWLQSSSAAKLAQLVNGLEYKRAQSDTIYEEFGEEVWCAMAEAYRDSFRWDRMTQREEWKAARRYHRHLLKGGNTIKEDDDAYNAIVGPPPVVCAYEGAVIESGTEYVLLPTGQAMHLNCYWHHIASVPEAACEVKYYTA